jgi:hypothetical protein
MPHVRRVINGRTARVPFDVARLHGYEGFLFPRECVAEEEMTGGDGVG